MEEKSENKIKINDAFNNAYGVGVKDWFYLLFAIIVISGIVGFVYEELFYRIDLGMWVKRGTEYGPWIDIYAWGALLLTFTVWFLRKHPLAVFLVSGGLCGVIEYITGYALLNMSNGHRSWDYNVEILSWGNINGFVCARSVLLFGIGGLALVYMIIPIVKNFYNKPKGQGWKNTMTVLCIIYFADVAVSYILGHLGINPR